MAQVEWADAIKTVSGALTKINKKSQHAGDQKMILATHRKAATTNPNCSRIYMRGLSSVTRSTPVTVREQLARTRFLNVQAAVKARAKNLTTLPTTRQPSNSKRTSPAARKPGVLTSGKSAATSTIKRTVPNGTCAVDG